MPVAYKDLSVGDRRLGEIGYLKYLPHIKRDIWLGALFIVNALGEPVEFAHARIRPPKSNMWRPSDLKTRCLESLTSAVFDACPIAPQLILFLANEADPVLFSDRVIPDAPAASICVDSSTGEITHGWIVEPPQGSNARMLLDRISDMGLLIEPFERAEAGLHEVYKELIG